MSNGGERRRDPRWLAPIPHDARAHAHHHTARDQLMVVNHSNDGAVHVAADTPSRHAPLDGFPEPPPWIKDALCSQTDPEAFFPEKGGSTREAKAICHRCTVQAECLDWALDNDERFGIWGGLSERDRRRIKKASNPPAANFPHDQESA